MRLLSQFGLMMCVAGGAFGQAAPAPAFEVASVKTLATVSDGARNLGRPDQLATSPGGVTMTNYTLRSAIAWAYHVQPVQVTGPGWLESDRYQILAKAAGPTSVDQLRLMMQTLLAERFKVTQHKDTKEMQAYVLTVAKGGHKLTRSEGEAEMQMNAGPGGSKALVTHATIDRITALIASMLPGIVVDQTGLDGEWDFSLDITNVMDSHPTGIDDAIGMIAQLAKQQLGINVDQKKLPVEMVVVDRAERVPVGN